MSALLEEVDQELEARRRINEVMGLVLALLLPLQRANIHYDVLTPDISSLRLKFAFA